MQYQYRTYKRYILPVPASVHEVSLALLAVDHFLAQRQLLCAQCRPFLSPLNRLFLRHHLKAATRLSAAFSPLSEVVVVIALAVAVSVAVALNGIFAFLVSLCFVSAAAGVARLCRFLLKSLVRAPIYGYRPSG
jgi:hypothetical protein